ncbi:MAG: universal stress protein [Hydrogenophaga sp.]|nr:universal stress protein [Hydrogenophaga sp.]
MNKTIDNDNKVLACVDQSPFAATVADYAAWAARRMGAPLEFLHVIDRHPALGKEQDHSGAIGPGAQEALLNQLSSDDEQRSRAAREAGRVFLLQLRDRALAAGVAQVDTRQRHGDVEETLSSQQDGTRLAVLGRRGQAAAADSQKSLGGHVEWVVRSLQRPILAVPAQYREPSRVLIAFDGSAITRRAIDTITANPLLKGLPLHLLSAADTPGSHQKALDSAQETLRQAGFDVTAGSVPGKPAVVIDEAIRTEGFDLLVMGAYSHSPLRSWLFGSNTTALLRATFVPTLLLR